MLQSAEMQVRHSKQKSEEMLGDLPDPAEECHSGKGWAEDEVSCPVSFCHRWGSCESRTEIAPSRSSFDGSQRKETRKATWSTSERA